MKKYLNILVLVSLCMIYIEARADNQHVCFNNATGSPINFKVCHQAENTCWSPVELNAYEGMSFRKIKGVNRQTNRNGTITIYGQVLNFAFNWAGKGDDHKTSDSNWVCNLHSYEVKANNGNYYLTKL